tara:strand:+ start:268 stop:1602 length:1335 start_codon:yes stop_codon:yes gene_type:complete
MTSRYVSIRPDNIPSDGKVSFKNGFPVLSFTIQAQNGILNPESIRIAGQAKFYKDNASPPTPINSSTGIQANQVTMDNRLGIYNVFDQVIIRHNKSKQVCEHIRHYPRYLSSYLGLGSSKQDLMGHMGEANLIMPNSDCFFETVMCNNASDSMVNHFSTYLPTGFLRSGNMINLMEQSFGGIQIEIHLSPDQNTLFSRTGSSTGILDAHYVLSNLELTFEVSDVPAEEQARMASQTQGSLSYNTIQTLYTSINSTNAQLQFNLGLKAVQSVFMNFCPSANINTIQANGNATTYPSNTGGGLVHFKRIQFLRGGVKYPLEFDIVTNKDTDPSTSVPDGELIKQFVDSVIPEYMTDRTSVSVQNNNRQYVLDPASGDSYLDVADGGALFGIGMKYSQYNSGQDFSNQQWGVSLESDLTTDNPQSVFIYVKSRATLLWGQNGIQIVQ